MMRVCNLVFRLVVGLALPALAQAASFEGVTQFQAVPLEGQVTLICDDDFQHEVKFIICEQTRLEPFEFGRFEAERGTGADELALICKQANGRQVEMTSAYDSIRGRSLNRFNLWAVTLLQRALLAPGLNHVSYELRRGRTITASGAVDMTVHLAPPRSCRPRQMYSQFQEDCDFEQRICDRYFDEENNCRAEGSP